MSTLLALSSFLTAGQLFDRMSFSLLCVIWGDSVIINFESLAAFQVLSILG